MVYVLNDPQGFSDDFLEGLVAAYGRFLRAVPGGVVQASPAPQSQVAVVVGGGSGHYPAFGGLVGPGLAAGAAIGNVFASPSATSIVSVAKAAHSGAGVLFVFGNYTGDVLNFALAQDMLVADGMNCRTVAVTDDVASASEVEMSRRRGIAGDLTVFKVTGAAAAEGLSLDQVFAVAERANARTRTLGVAFSGCTLPGDSDPLFTVPVGEMAVGMGIHGEPGLRSESVPSADALAGLLVADLLAEAPADSRESDQRVALVLNGLGGVKYEELFVLYRRVAQLLNEAGLEVVEPEVGELVTSFDMAGVSLTLMWLDPQLEKLWCAPAESPGFRRGSTHAQPAGPVRQPPFAVPDLRVSLPEATTSDDSARAAGEVVIILESVRDRLDDARDQLGKLDAVAGDGDHGIGMQRGATAAARAASEAAAAGAGLGTTLRRAGEAWAERAGGTSGILWGLLLRRIGEELGDASGPTAAKVAAAVEAAERALRQFGEAQVGDKTMVDALVPFSEKLTTSARSGMSLTDSWSSSAAVAESAAEGTSALLPLRGRARPHAERSLGIPDPGAISFAMVATTVAETLTRRGPTHD